MWGFLSTLFTIWCIWRILAWIWAKRKLKQIRRQEEKEQKEREERMKQYAAEQEEKRRLRHERYLAHLEEERVRRESPEYKAQLEAEKAERLKREKESIAYRLKEKQRVRDLEKQVRQELIDSGELFGDQTKRPPIPREVVDAVFRRDGGRCQECGATEDLQLDHIIPFSKGGATSVENLQLLCGKCNREKSNKIG